MRLNPMRCLIVVLAATLTADAFADDRVKTAGSVIEGTTGPNEIRAFPNAYA
jgi:hypothetical protein